MLITLKGDLVYTQPKASGWGASSDNGLTWTPGGGDETESIVKQDPDAFGADSAVMDGAGESTAAVWFMERVCVQLKKNGAKAVIREMYGGRPC